LFNALTGASVHAEDQLFATLDPTMRGVTLPSGRRIILSDTVGFISDLPTELVAAFRATLEEVAEADIILHVRDIAHPDSAAQKADVLNVLGGMARDGMLDEDWPSRTIEVLNKADLLGGVEAVTRVDGAVAISAITGQGLPNLFAALDAKMTAAMKLAHARIDVTDGAALAWLYEHGEVLERLDRDDGIALDVRLFEQDRARFEQLHPGCLVSAA
jgi:GTP-binding protein HflX